LISIFSKNLLLFNLGAAT